ncbi:hypothetical protein Glove_130g113 [Diversispora epigaea]|uniref:Uncharacterized protein n=1 Tax=Diversispora epigaea TaxID=1348612 RepID=A0A397J4H0_9GLOM|nr:hypothetical protein Glove_130g113 [Diversispora epigaea]
MKGAAMHWYLAQMRTYNNITIWRFSKPNNNNNKSCSNYNNNYNRLTPKDNSRPIPMGFSYLGENKPCNRTHYQKNKYFNNKNNNYNNSNNKGNNKRKEIKGNCFKCGKPGHYVKKYYS